MGISAVVGSESVVGFDSVVRAEAVVGFEAVVESEVVIEDREDGMSILRCECKQSQCLTRRCLSE